jgi:hypothetical protein
MLEGRRVVLGWGAAALGCLLLPSPVPAAADSLPLLPKPLGGEIILTISGAIGRSNGDGSAFFDLALLKTLPARQIVTETPWTKGLHTFTGVPLADLMTWVGASGGEITADALNDYSVDLSLGDGAKYGGLVAYLLDGQPMLPSDRGPLWLVYPFSDRPEIQTESVYMRSVWNLYALTVR